MGKLRNILLAILLLAGSASAVSLTGTFRYANGNRLNGKIRLTLSRPAQDPTDTSNVVPTVREFRIRNGSLPTDATLKGNDILQPSGTYYVGEILSSRGRLLSRTNYVVTGSSFDMGGAVPTSVTTSNVRFQDLIGIRRIGPIRFCDGFAGADAGAKITACIADLPSTGGVADARGLEGAQAVSTTVTITNPVELLLGAALLTSSVAPAFSFDAGSDGSSLICTAATRITFANGMANFSRLIRIQNTSNITIKGCATDGNGNNAAAGEQNHNIFITGSTDVWITGNVIHDAQGDGIFLADADRVSITNNTFFNLGRMGVTLFGPTINNISVTNNKFRVGSRVTTSTTAGNFVHGEGAIVSGAGRNITVSGNQMEGQGISFTTTDSPWSGVQIKGNVIRPDESAALGAAILLRDTQDFTIEGNEIIGDTGVNRIGIHVQEIGASSVTGRGVIANNVIRDIGNECISISGTFTPALGQLSITGNVLTGCGDLGIQVETEWPQVQIANNIIRDSVDWGIDFQDSQDFVIAGNILIDNGTRGIQVQVTGGTAAGRGLIFGNEVRYATPAGTQGINIASVATIDRILIFGNDLADTATPLTLGALATNLHAYMNLTGTSTIPVWTSPINSAGVTFANLGTPANGTITFCSDCAIANPCAGAGTGALAKRLNSVWVCN